MNLNETVLQNAHESYTTAMDDWFRNDINATTPFFTAEQLSEKRQVVEEAIKNYTINQWKGPDVIAISFQNRLREVL